MRESIAVLIVLVFLTASCLVVNPALSFAEIAENSWAPKAPLSKARHSLGAAVVNGKIYAIGGIMLTYQDSLRTESKEVGINEEYDPATNTWTLKTPMPEPFSDFATAVCEGKIYCIGGGVSQFFNFSTGRWDTKLSQGINAVYDPATDTWEMKTPMPTPQASAQAHVVNGQIYCLGGFPNSTLNEVYDPATDTWTMKASSSDPIGSSTVVDNKIYCIGSDHKWRIYDPATDSWSVGSDGLPDFLTGAYVVATTGVTAPKRIYVFYNPSDAPNGWIYENQVYDPEADGWMSATRVPTQRDDFAVAVVDDLIYVIGGLTITYPDIESWSTGGITTIYATVEQYAPFGYGTVPPAVSITSPESMATYASSGVPLNFSLNKPPIWMGYSVDGQEVVIINGSITLEGLDNGVHNVTVYAEDEFGNVGVSETVSFAVDVPFSAIFVIVPIVSVTVLGVGVLVYFKKRKR